MKAINFMNKLSSIIVDFYNECTLLEPLMKKQMKDVEYYSEPGFVVLILETDEQRFEQEFEINRKDELEAKRIERYKE